MTKPKPDKSNKPNKPDKPKRLTENEFRAVLKLLELVLDVYKLDHPYKDEWSADVCIEKSDPTITRKRTPEYKEDGTKIRTIVIPGCIRGTRTSAINYTINDYYDYLNSGTSDSFEDWAYERWG